MKRRFKDQFGLENELSLAYVVGLAGRVREARRRANLSQSELARFTGVSASAVSQWENPDGTQPDLDRVLRIAVATGVTLDWLIAGAETPASAFVGALAKAVDAPALALDAFAHSVSEERLLERFRRLSIGARDIVERLVHEMSAATKPR
jgi:transcriptional regulator with XRE-family HTH domain